jgi:hypothetical protein
VTLTPGRQDRFRVRAVDTLGNSSLSKPVTSTLRVIDSDAPDWRFASSGWTSKSSPSAFRGSLLVPGAAPKALLADFRGSTVALVAPVGPGRGTLRVRVDDDPWQAVGLVAPANAQRRVVFSRRLTPGEHVIKVQRAGGLVAVDAILVLD